MSTKNTARNIIVFAHWEGLKEPIIIGNLQAQLLRGKEIFSFEYNNKWLQSNHVQSLDPDLLMFKGRQYLNDDIKPNFGMFLDSSPDRWGRILMRKREAALARKEERKEKSLFETDYLLGVYDLQRMGGLRFKEYLEGPFLNFDDKFSIPPWTSIRTLEEISLRIEEDDIVDDPDYLNWLNMLLAPGSSLGGARPKAGIIDKNNQLWIAKFPSKNDHFDVGGWEIIVNELASEAGLNIAEAISQKFSSTYHTFITKRFDRSNRGERIHFASAMTMLGYNDGQDCLDGVSYLELAEFIMQSGARVNQDLEELWRRIVFNICISNTDDHLRNHGFILTKEGWRLSPVYDINPIETGTGLKLNINENDNALDLDLAMEVHEYFRVDLKKANEIMQKVKVVVGKWKEVANKYHISRNEQDLKARAFSKAF